VDTIFLLICRFFFGGDIEVISQLSFICPAQDAIRWGHGCTSGHRFRSDDSECTEMCSVLRSLGLKSKSKSKISQRYWNQSSALLLDCIQWVQFTYYVSIKRSEETGHSRPHLGLKQHQLRPQWGGGVPSKHSVTAG
jgi:hypothetical protein